MYEKTLLIIFVLACVTTCGTPDLWDVVIEKASGKKIVRTTHQYYFLED